MMRLLLGMLPLIALSGCETTCKSTCEKLLACDEVSTPLLDEDDCEDTCAEQELLYEEWDDGAKRDALSDYKSCVVDEECGAIADGACYDELLYIW